MSVVLIAVRTNISNQKTHKDETFTHERLWLFCLLPSVNAKYECYSAPPLLAHDNVLWKSIEGCAAVKTVRTTVYTVCVFPLGYYYTNRRTYVLQSHWISSSSRRSFCFKIFLSLSILLHIFFTYVLIYFWHDLLSPPLNLFCPFYDSYFHQYLFSNVFWT